MKQAGISIFCTILPFFVIQAQNHTGEVKGKLVDKEDKQPLSAATVTLQHLPDSVVAYTAFTDKSGSFHLKGIAGGKYRLLVTYLGYRSMGMAVEISAGDLRKDIGVLATTKRDLSLKEVEIIEAIPPVTIKKDTLEFHADAFKTRENAMVEELLKKLPGVQVEKDGTVKAQGETVKKVLVDGKTFFGNDPKIATRNLPANIVDKVQIIDKKSDQAEFTKIDDGQTEKAINLTIKPDKKKGYFGRASAGYGTDDRFSANLSLHRFREDQQLSFLGGGNNVNDLGFTFQDAFSFSGMNRGGGLNASSPRGGGSGNVMVKMGGGNGGGAMNIGELSIGSSSEGLSRNWNAGINYSDNWAKNLRVSGSYFFNDTKTDIEKQTARQNILPDTTYYYNENNRALNNNTNHRANFRMEYDIDSMHSLIITPSLSYSKGEYQADNQYQSLDENKRLINNGHAQTSSSITSPEISTNLLFRKRFNKEGRTLSVNMNLQHNTATNDSRLYSINEYYQQNGGSFADTLNQQSRQESDKWTTGVKVTYTEPVFTDRYLELSYGYNRDYNTADKRTYDYNLGNAKYDQLNDSLSNAYKNSFVMQEAGISIRTQKLKYDYTLGLNMQFTDLNSHNITRDSTIQQRNVNFFPVASFNYSFSGGKRLRFMYQGNNRQPTLTELQPVPDNSDPLYIKQGNPDLQPEFSNNFNLQYQSFSRSSMRLFLASLNANFTSRKIVNANSTNQLGQQTSKPVNADGAYSINAFVVNTFPLKLENTAIHSNTSANYNRDISFINTVKNYTKNLTLTQRLSFNYAHKELFDISTGAQVNYNAARYTVQQNNNTNFFNYVFSIDGNLNLPKGFIIGSDLDYTVNTGRTEGYNQQVTMLNAFVSKSVFKKQQGVIKLSVFDILNQNVSIRRNVAENYIEDVETRVLQRYFLLSFTYHLNKFGGGGGKMLRAMPMRTIIH